MDWITRRRAAPWQRPPSTLLLAFGPMLAKHIWPVPMSCIAVIWITTRARSELALAQRSLPNNAQVLILIGYIDRRQGRWSESVQEMERALSSTPATGFIFSRSH